MLNDILDAPGNGSIQVVVLNPNQDGVAQMTTFLSRESNVTAVQVISHGGDGALLLGNTLLSGANLNDYSDDLASWRQALAPGADLLLYGCDVAEDASGQAFVDSLGQLTGTRVAANTGLTGTSRLGGSWDPRIPDLRHRRRPRP